MTSNVRKISFRLLPTTVSATEDEEDSSKEEDPYEGSLWVDRCIIGIDSLL